MNVLWTVISTLLLLTAASAGVFGWWRAWPTARMSRLEAVGVLLTGGPAVVCLAGILLADGGRFSLLSLWLVVALILAGAVGVWCWRRPSGNGYADDDAPRAPAETSAENWPWTPRVWSVCVLLGVLLAALPVLRPYTHLHGGWDPGEYVCTAANLARTGSLRVQDPFFSAQDAPVRRMLMAEPDGNRQLLHSGYLVQDEAAGLLTPDFFHLYPVWLATFATVGGVHGSYWGQWVITILAVAMFVLLLKALFSTRAAILGMLLLAAGPGQVYFGRFTSAEMLTRFFLFGTFFWLAATLRQPAWRRDLAAGVLCGLAFLVHSTSVIPLVGVGLFLGGHALWTGRLSSLRSLLVVAGCGLLALLRNAMQTPVMTEFLFGFISHHPFLLLPAAGLAVVALAGLVVAVRLRGRQRRRGWVWPPLAARVARWVPGLAVVAFLVYQGVIRPFDPAGGWERLNMILAGRMAGPLTVVLAGAFFCRRRWTRWSGGEALFWFAGGLTAAVLIQYRMAHPLVMWSLRRYMPLVVPLLVAAGAVVLADMAVSASRRIRWAAMAVLLVTIGGLGWESWPMLRVREHRGLPAFTRTLAEALAGADFILCDSIRYATPLRYAWGLPAYQFSRQQDAVDTGEAAAAAGLLAARVAAGERVYYLTVSDGFAHPAFQLVADGRFDQMSEVLRMHLPTLPRTVLPAPNRARLFRCVPHGSEALDAAARAALPGVATPITTGYHSLGLVSGFGKVYRQSTPAFRWTDGAGVLCVPAPGPEGGVLELMLASGRAMQAAPVAVEVVLDGRRLDTLAVGREWTRHRVPVPPMAATTACRLELRSEVWNPADHGVSGYPTNLGIRVASVQMLPPGERIERATEEK